MSTSKFLDVLDIDRPRVIGHGTGGWIAFVAALSHPERISGLMA